MGMEIGFFPIYGIEIFIRIIDGVARKRLGILEIKRRTKKILIGNQPQYQYREK
jgi:hypothetical protein